MNSALFSLDLLTVYLLACYNVGEKIPPHFSVKLCILVSVLGSVALPIHYKSPNWTFSMCMCTQSVLYIWP